MSALLAITRQGYRGSFWWTPWRAWTANMVVRPITYLMVFGVLHRELGLAATASVVLALCTYCVLVTVLTCSNHAIRNDHGEGTFTIALSTPVRPTTLWLTRTAAHVPNGVASAASALVFAAVGFGLDLGELDAAAMVALATVLVSAVAVSMLVGVLTRRLADWVGPVALASGVLLTLSGAVIPRADLPGPVRVLSAGVPLAHANDALRRSFRFDAGSPWGDVAAELAVALAVGAVALVLFARSIRRARALGTLTVEGT